MTSRELNREWNKHGIVIEYEGYEQHGDEKVRAWVVYHEKYNYACRVWSLEQAEYEAKCLRHYIEEVY